MLAHPTLDKLNDMGLTGMAKAFNELLTNGESEQLSHAEWLGLLLEREWSSRHDRKLAARLRFAKLRHHAVPEDVDYRSERGLDRALFVKLIGGDWIDAHDNLAVCGSSGVGKSWLACALGHKACREIGPFCISAYRACSPISLWLTAMAGMQGLSAPSAMSNS